VRTTGTYNVTIRVTDDDGGTRSDTLRVTVESVEPPSVTLSGPQEVDTSENVTFEAAASAGDGDLAEVTWLVNGSRVARESVEGEAATAALTHAFAEGGSYELQVRVTSRFGRTATATRLVDVAAVENASTIADELGVEGTGAGCPDVETADKCEKKEFYVNPNDDSQIILIDITGDGYAWYNGFKYDMTEGRETDYEHDNAGESVTRAIDREEARQRGFERRYGSENSIENQVSGDGREDANSDSSNSNSSSNSGRKENNSRGSQSINGNGITDDGDREFNRPYGPRGPTSNF
jgi:hypothetical protein